MSTSIYFFSFHGTTNYFYHVKTWVDYSVKSKSKKNHECFSCIGTIFPYSYIDDKLLSSVKDFKKILHVSSAWFTSPNIIKTPKWLHQVNCKKRLDTLFYAFGWFHTKITSSWWFPTTFGFKNLLAALLAGHDLWWLL